MAKLPTEDIAKAVSGAVSSVLSKMEADKNSDDEDFQAEWKRLKPRIKEVQIESSRKGHGGLGGTQKGSRDPLQVKRRKLILKEGKLQKKTFYYIGVLFGLSLIRGGPATHSAVADYIVYGASNVKAGPLDMVDFELREKIQKIQIAKSLSQLKQLLDSDAYGYDISNSTFVIKNVYCVWIVDGMMKVM
uniref:Uncharacterized protein n=1 Tax=Amphimedon queenslandica TaxID=400682 RepID=A0A1X7VEY8_AMPQE